MRSASYLIGPMMDEEGVHGLDVEHVHEHHADEHGGQALPYLMTSSQQLDHTHLHQDANDAGSASNVGGVVDDMSATTADFEPISSRHQLTVGEKMLVVRCHEYLQREKTAMRNLSQRPLREQVSECTGLGEATIGRIIADFRSHGGKGFSQPKPRTGRPPIIDSQVLSFMRSYVREHTIASNPITIPTLTEKMKSLNIANVAPVTVWRALRRMGFRFAGRGHLAETVEVVSNRSRYIRSKIDNRDELKCPIKPEIVIGETLCGRNGVKSLTSLSSLASTPPKEASTDPKFYILSAGCLRSDGHRLVGEWVSESLHFLPYLTKAMKKSRARKRSQLNEDDTDATLSMHLTVSSPQAYALPQPLDQNGNVNVDWFEHWFRDLCKHASETYGECVLFLDGARHHKRRVNPLPNLNARKEDLQSWLRTNNIPFDSCLGRPELAALIRLNRPMAQYACEEIAHEFGHTLMFIPAFHPELNPMEVMWGHVSEELSANPAASFDDLRERLRTFCERKMTVEMWTAALIEAQSCEDKYLMVLDSEVVADNSDVEADEDDSLSWFC